MRNKTIYAVALLTFLASCDKNPQRPSEYATDSNAVRIDASVGALTRSNPLGTAEEQTRFNAGDKIAVIHTSANKLVNYVYDGTSWAPEGEDYLVWRTDVENTFTLRYPADDWSKDYLALDQSTLEEMSRSDLMEAANVKVTPIPSDRRLVAELERQRSLVTVEIAGFNDEFNAGNAKVTDLKLYLWDGSQGDEINPVVPYIRDEKGVHQPKGTAGLVGYTYTAIGRNDCNYSQYKDKYFIELTVAGKTLVVANPPAMEPGKRYTYRLAIGKESVKITGVTVEDWTSGGVLDGTYETVTDRYSVWDGSVDTDIPGRDGEFCAINTAAQFAGLAKLVNEGENFDGKTVELRTNIDLNGLPWTPIGNDLNDFTKCFSGIFDGQSHSIINVNISGDHKYCGLFGTLYNGEIRNLNVRNCKVKPNALEDVRAGLLVGGMRSAKVNGCKAQGEIIMAGNHGHCGGIVGNACCYNYKREEKSVISDCEAEVDISPASSDLLSMKCGGIAGSFDWGTIDGCKSKGKIEAGNYAHVGGLVGKVCDDDSVRDFDRSVIRNSDSYVAVRGGLNTASIGGFSGFVSYCTVTNCSAYGTIDASECEIEMSPDLGGMFGICRFNLRVTDVHFRGTVVLSPKGTGDRYGAFIGWLQSNSCQTKNCTYKDSRVNGLTPIGKISADVDPEQQDIKGI